MAYLVRSFIYISFYHSEKISTFRVFFTSSLYKWLNMVGWKVKIMFYKIVVLQVFSNILLLKPFQIFSGIEKLKQLFRRINQSAYLTSFNHTNFFFCTLNQPTTVPSQGICTFPLSELFFKIIFLLTVALSLRKRPLLIILWNITYITPISYFFFLTLLYSSIAIWPLLFFLFSFIVCLPILVH